MSNIKVFLSVFAGLVLGSAAFAQQRTYNTSNVLVEINDPKAQRNPIRSVRAVNWKAVEVGRRLKPKPGQDVAIVCEGKFPAGYIADDLYRNDGTFNRRLSVSKETTILDLCNQMEDDMRRVSPHLFK